MSECVCVLFDVDPNIQTHTQTDTFRRTAVKLLRQHLVVSGGVYPSAHGGYQLVIDNLFPMTSKHIITRRGTQNTNVSHVSNQPTNLLPICVGIDACAVEVLIVI